MIKKIILLLFCIYTSLASAQIVGKVTDLEGNPLPYVNIYLENTYVGTTTNDDGNFELSVTNDDSYSVIFQFLGYKTVSKKINIVSFPYILNVSMTEESVSLDEVIISNDEDPAYRIIRETIARRKHNLEKISEYTADFYSRGLWKVENAPLKIMGRDLGDLEGALDSTRSGIIYLSESISKLSYRQPDEFNEKIIASKVSGNDNGFSFNSAQEANFSFYENTIDLNAPIVSPIGASAMSYYNYKLDGIFYEGDKLINKIKVTPKRPKDRVWEGYIYIVEDDWQLYGVEIKTNGAAIQVPFIKELVFKQNFKFDPKYNFWVKISQTIDFGFGFLGLNGDGRFIAVYSNYDFKPKFEKRHFTNEVLSFEAEANKKDSIFWKGTRPVPLTNEELTDYIKKDSLQVLRRSKPYLDSLDQKSNQFGLLDPLTGYTYKNSFKKWRVSYDGPLKGIAFSTLQGWNSSAGLSFFRWFDENQTRWFSLRTDATYGISDDRLRFTGRATYNFNRKNNLRFSLAGGSKIEQFNSTEPISLLINSIATTFFERNYLKAYELNFARISYFQEVVNGIELQTRVGYENRKPLFNETDQIIVKNKNVSYTSNNPLAPLNFNSAAIDEHDIVKVDLSTRITFGQKYFSNPDMKFNIGNERYPRLTLGLESGFGASNSNYNYSQVKAALDQELSLGNKGKFYYNLKGGTFFNAEDISFADYQHFNGNQTRVGTSVNYTNVFNLLPYYDQSTNKSYFEGHLEHDFKGWILGKIPGINQLNFNLIAGAHLLSREDNKPYTEWSVGIDNLGIGKYRLLRLDYVRSYHNGVSDGAFIFGLKFLDLLGL
ncbi:DUF5686 and carboxypeptidase regulatory-like domain-containing protein [Ulvibacter antarcticus]|nr:DUF5686 and carboxypeptidase regulatory-like domain-containing protein [Ulvibacter antarcticus]